jgi:hypothetical protein
MQCPSCQSTVADDAAVCPRCDAVLDPSLLDAAPPEADGDGTGAPPARPAPRSRGKKVVRRAAPGQRPPVKASTPRSRMPEAPAREQRAGPSDWRQKVNQDDWNEMPQREPEAFVADKGLDPDDVLQDASGFMMALSAADKLAFFGAAAMLLSTFFPWKESVTEGEVLGVTSSGLVVTLLSLLSLSAVVLRVRRAFPVNPVLPWVVQLGATALSLLWCFVYVRLSWDSTLVRAPIGNLEVWASKPTFGVIFCLMATGVSGLGTVLGLKELGR